MLGGGETEGGGEEEEKKDQLLENPVSSAILRASIRSLSPFRRHSWEPGRSNTAADIDITHRRYWVPKKQTKNLALSMMKGFLS